MLNNVWMVFWCLKLSQIVKLYFGFSCSFFSLQFRWFVLFFLPFFFVITILTTGTQRCILQSIFALPVLSTQSRDIPTHWNIFPAYSFTFPSRCMVHKNAQSKTLILGIALIAASGTIRMYITLYPVVMSVMKLLTNPTECTPEGSSNIQPFYIHFLYG